MHVTHPILRDRRVRRLGIAVAVLVVAIAVLALVFDPNWLKGPIERRVEAATGHTLSIRGDLDIRLGRAIRVSADDVVLGNAKWAQSPDLARADRIAIDIATWPLFAGRVRLPRIELDRPRLDLERNAHGDANWKLDRRTRRPGRPVRFDSLVIRNGTLRLREPRLDTDLRLDIRTGERGAREPYAPLLAKGSGRYRRQDFTLDGRADSPLELLGHGNGYRIDFRVGADDTHAHVHGTLTAPIDLHHFELAAHIDGQDLSDLYTLLDFAVPESPPYSLEGKLARDGSTIHYRDFHGRIGDTDMAGDMSVELDRSPPYARARLVSKHLDLDDLAVLVGAPPATGEGETANAAQRAQAAERARGTRVLPDRPFHLGKLRSLDADVTLEATEVESKRLPVESISVHATLGDGVLRLRPLDLGLAGGKVDGSIELDARHDVLRSAAELKARDIDLPRLAPRFKETSIGRVAGNARLTARGNSLAQMFAAANGEISTGMGKGRMSNLLLELAGLDVAESLKFLLGRDKAVDVRCAYADFSVEDGVMHSRAMALDTSDTVITGEGKVDLKDERLDLTLRPRPRDVSPVALRVPLQVGGTLKDPKFRPEAGPLAARTAIAGVLYAIAPPAALLALIETGPGGKAACGPVSDDPSVTDKHRTHSASSENDRHDDAAADDDESKTGKPATHPWKSPTG
jgi:uncharacterized protein involved in outer membrane biogenesis